MRTRISLLVALAFATALPLAAGHRHGRDCGHYYSGSRGGWVSFSVVTPWGAGSFGKGYDRGPRYYDRGYYDHGPYYRDKHAYKRYLKEQRRRQKYLRRHRHSRHCRH